MQLTTLSDAPGYDDARVVVELILNADHANVRIIRLSPGQALPPHTHGTSDVMLYVVEGTGRLDTPVGTVDFAAGALAHLAGDQELRVRNAGDGGMTLLAFFAPPFPPAR